MKTDLARATLLSHEVFCIHMLFISITFIIFPVLTWRFASEIAFAVNPVSLTAIYFTAAFGRSM